MDFIKRNTPVIVIGILTLLVFIGIIIAGQKKTSPQPSLEQISEADELEEKVKEEIDKVKASEPVVDEVIVNETTSSQTTNFPILEIEYTQNGFSPKNTTGYPGQLVRWTNKTDKPITMVQTTSKFPELEGGIIIAPGATFEFRLYKDRIWTYKEKETNNFGSIYISAY